MARKADEQGWIKRTMGYNGSSMKGNKYSYCKESTVDSNFTLWVRPGKTTSDYVVVRSIWNSEEKKITDTTVAQFPTAKEAKEWADKEFAHMFA